MDIASFEILPALAGGVLIGLAGIMLMALNGRIAGISGIFGGLLPPRGGDMDWRLTFVIGLVLGGLVYAGLGGDVAAIRIDARYAMIIPAGLLVGFGTQWGSGCTSGHGVCGIGRLSPRGLTATIIYIGVAGLVVFITRHVLGG